PGHAAHLPRPARRDGAARLGRVLGADPAALVAQAGLCRPGGPGLLGRLLIARNHSATTTARRRPTRSGPPPPRAQPDRGGTMPYYWGVDSAAATNWAAAHEKGKSISLYDHATAKLGRKPDFFGRYIGGKYSISGVEAD